MLTGVVLLAIALGWALLAVLSIRFSDQPQRWAFVPAAFLALAGLVSLSGLPAVQAVFGWVWPLVLFALVVWMFLRVRRIRSRGGRWLLYPLLAVLLVASVGGGYETVRESLDASAYPDARPAGRRWRAPAAPALHRLGQPHRRPRTRWRRVLLGRRLDCAGGGPRHHGLRVRPRRPRMERRHGQPAGRDPHRRGPAHAARPRPHSRPVRAGRSLVRRSLRPELRRAIPRPGRRHGATGLHRTQTRPARPPTPSPPRSSAAGGTGVRGRPPGSRAADRPVLLRHSAAARPGRGPTPTPRPPGTSPAPSRSSSPRRTRRCRRRRP